MLQAQFIKDNTELVLAGLQKKHYATAETDVATIVQLDAERKSVQFELDNTLRESNEAAKVIGQLMKEGKKSEAEEKKNHTVVLKEKSKDLGEKLAEIEKSL